jgi:hypothetical protein
MNLSVETLFTAALGLQASWEVKEVLLPSTGNLPFTPPSRLRHVTIAIPLRPAL